MEKFELNKNQLVMTRAEVRSFDSWAINKLGIPGVILMENAGRSCAEIMKDNLVYMKEPKVCIFCGTGNNGGDGYVIARHLLNAGYKVTVVLCGAPAKVKGDAKINLDILRHLGQPIQQIDISSRNLQNQVTSLAADADMLVDGLFGTGLNGRLSEEFQLLINSINNLNIPILAVDIPSGLDCDSGEALGAAIKAACTVTFVAVKKGFTYIDKVSKYTGQIFIASIGIDPSERWNP